MESPNICPFCGGKPIQKNPFFDRIKKVGADAKVSEVSAGSNIEIESNPEKEQYYLCNGCNQKYVWAPIDINLILNHLKAGENIARLIYHYYSNEVTLTDLLTKYRTGIVRRYSMLSFLSKKIVKRQLYSIQVQCRGYESSNAECCIFCFYWNSHRQEES